jgi:hypothetical protein
VPYYSLHSTFPVPAVIEEILYPPPAPGVEIVKPPPGFEIVSASEYFIIIIPEPPADAF